MKVAVAADGSKMEFIHSDAAVKLLGGLGETSMRRASHVEPFNALSLEAQNNWLEDNAGKPITQKELAASWFADMSPVGGRTLGPFPTKAAALQAEVKWIESNALCLTTKTAQPS